MQHIYTQFGIRTQLVLMEQSEETISFRTIINTNLVTSITSTGKLNQHIQIYEMETLYLGKGTK